MNKKFLVLIGLICALATTPGGAVTINKAKSVEKKTTTTTDSASSLVPTVLGLVSTVQALNAKQNAMTAECVPSAQEIRFVNQMVQEWAKTGSASADEAERALGMKRCVSGADGGYAANVRMMAGVEEQDFLCTDWFGDENAIWYQYPKAAVVKYCDDGLATCKNQKTASNIYNIFSLIDFGPDDYTRSEATMAAKLLNKIENCSDAKLSAKKRAMWGEFLIDTVGNMGGATNTGAIMQQVQSGVSAGGLGSLGSLGSLVQGFM